MYLSRSIRVDSSVEWSQDNSIPVVEYKKSSRSAREYMRLAEEVMEIMSVGRESIRRAANAGAGNKNVKKEACLYSAKRLQRKPENKYLLQKEKKKKQQKVLFILNEELAGISSLKVICKCLSIFCYFYRKIIKWLRKKWGYFMETEEKKDIYNRRYRPGAWGK